MYNKLAKRQKNLSIPGFYSLFGTIIAVPVFEIIVSSTMKTKWSQGMAKILAVLILILLLGAAQVVWATPPSDPNIWATASAVGPDVGSPAGSYSTCWTINPTSEWPAGWLLVGVEFSPDGKIGRASCRERV